jgi:tRNA A-37 threonylcarbamoyl transferase component Bud32
VSENVPKLLGRYQIQEEIGRGMMGVVYRAIDPALGRTVALKTVRLAFTASAADAETFEKRFMAEARAAAGLSHPGIVVVHDVGRDSESGTLYIALEFLQGRTLSEVTPEGRTLEWREALRLTGRLAEALQEAHAAGIVHRDIKPANIMVLPSGEPKIMDFGIAKVPTSQLTSAGEFFGTPSYMSPEQAKGEAVDGRSDLFSLGAVLYLLLTGRRAFDAPNVPAILSRVSTLDPPAPSSLVPDLPEAVDYLVARTLAKEPAQRYPDGKTLAEDVEDALAGRAPRHRRGWNPPRPAEGTWVSVEPLDVPETADIRPPATPPAPRGGEASLVLRVSDRLGTRGLVALGVLVAAGLVIALLLSHGAPPRTGTASPAPERAAASPASAPTPGSVLGGLFESREPAHLEVLFEHSLKGGTIKVWVDDDAVLEERLQSAIVRKIGPVKIRKGTLRKVLDVSPGEHMIKVQVQGDDFFGASRIKGEFEKGATRRLEVNKGGLPLMKKELNLDWS